MSTKDERRPPAKTVAFAACERALIEAQAECDTLRVENEQMTRGLSLYEREINDLRTWNTQLGPALISMTDERDALRAENTQLRAELETLKRQLTDAVLSLPPADDLDV